VIFKEIAAWVREKFPPLIGETTLHVSEICMAQTSGGNQAKIACKISDLSYKSLDAIFAEEEGREKPSRQEPAGS
jgi:hypothetical protein